MPTDTPPQLDALVTVDQLNARMLAPMTTAQQTQAAELLVDASARVRRYCRRRFTLTTEQITTTLRPVDGKIILRQTPIQSVDSVARVNPDGETETIYGLWIFDGIDTVLVGPPPLQINAPVVWTDVDWWWRDISYRVTYTHGDGVVPPEVTAVIAGMVIRALSSPAGPGVISETLPAYSYRMADPVMPGQVSLTAADKADLADFRRCVRSVELR